MPISILEKIRMGQWDYEPPKVDDSCFSPTRALPGSHEKLNVLAERIQQGLPLWHSDDSRSYSDLTGEDD